MIYLDTNAVMALDRSDLRLFSKEARRLLDREADIRISPMVILELEILREIGRLQGKHAIKEILAMLGNDIGLRICDLPFPDVARQAAAEGWTRDPFDRIVVAQARLAKAVLITRDTVMHAHYAKALT